jgi:hypothetical protein
MDRLGLPTNCQRCGGHLSAGFAKCHACGTIRPEFHPFAAAVRDEIDYCVWSGAETDVVLPNGHAIWAATFLGMIDEGWINSLSLNYTEVACQKHPDLRDLK